jgi:zinc transport system substrate-binding protein
VDSAAGFASQFIMIQSKTHSHGPDGDHTHEGLDGHTWLDPINAMEQSRAIHDALAALLPEHAQTLRANLDTLLDNLRKLDARLTAFAEKNRGTRLVASHPAYNYLGRRYQWALVSLDLDPSVPLTDGQIEEIRQAGLPTSGRASVMLWESEPIDAIRARLESEFGTPMVVFSPVEMLSPERLANGEDYLTVMHANIERLEAALNP